MFKTLIGCAAVLAVSVSAGMNPERMAREAEKEAFKMKRQAEWEGQ
jgi:hypothetical protein